MNKKRERIFLFLVLSLLLFLSGEQIYAQTTGKIAGKVTDKKTGEPLVGANIVIDGTTRGAAAGLDGEFFIINVPPGIYTLKIQMMGYKIMRYDKVHVSVNRTTDVDVKMHATIIEGEEIVVQAEKVAIKKDQTSTVRNVSSDQIDMLPVESVGAVVAMQAGVVNGHFRGGRSSEVAYLIDGVEVTESFGGEGRSVDLEPEAIQDLEVITGTFNAEYGNAMSGIVNAVTKEGGAKIHGSASASLGNFFTPNNDIFIGLKNSEITRNQDYKFQLSGPIWGNGIAFFTNVRYQDNKNHLNGVRRFNVDDYSDYSADNSDEWITTNTGDSSFIPMTRSKNLSFLGKVTLKPYSNFKVSLLYNYNDDEWHGYDHGYKYNPDGMAISYRSTNLYTINLNHMLSPKLFYELKLSYMNTYNGWYVFEDPLDSHYLHDAYHNNSGPGFYTGGQEKGHSERTMKDLSSKFDLTWQVNQRHSLKTGVLYTKHNLDNHWSEIRNKYLGTDEEGEYYYDYEKQKLIFPNYQSVIYPNSSIYSDIYRVKPIEVSGYIQDKMEFNEMVINLGIRYDYFNPKTEYPSDRRNPANQLDLPDTLMSTYPDAQPQTQVSPRFGLSYQLGNTALLHFSYGHFFQMPPMYAIYENNSLQVAPNDYTTTMGNCQIKAQRTVQYEIGLWQEIMRGMGVEVALFYRDIYDLLSAKIISTYNQIEYGLYSNKDYGNAKGLEIKYDFVRDNFSAYVNYTLQYTRGNADNPTQTFNRAGESRDPVSRLIPMSWDQRHTLNITVGYNTADYGVTLTGYYNSGTPFTWLPMDDDLIRRGILRVNLYPNNNWQPSRYSVDLSSFCDLMVIKDMKFRLTLNVYNLLDRLNDEWVDARSGRAYTTIIRETDVGKHKSDFNDYLDRVQNPSMYSAPRLVKVGLGVVF